MAERGRSLEQEVRRIADRLEIIDLMARWHQATDAFEWDEFRDRVLAEDFEWVWSGSDTSGVVRDVVRGRDAFIEWDTTAMGGLRVRHFVGGQVFLEQGPDTARTRCYMHVVDVASLATVANGLIVADHVRTPAGWRIRRIELDEQIMEGGVNWMARLLPDRLSPEPPAG